MQSLFFPCMKERDKRGSARRVFCCAYLLEKEAARSSLLGPETNQLSYKSFFVRSAIMLVISSAASIFSVFAFLIGCPG